MGGGGGWGHRFCQMLVKRPIPQTGPELDKNRFLINFARKGLTYVAWVIENMNISGIRQIKCPGLRHFNQVWLSFHTKLTLVHWPDTEIYRAGHLKINTDSTCTQHGRVIRQSTWCERFTWQYLALIIFIKTLLAKICMFISVDCILILKSIIVYLHNNFYHY